MLNNNELIQGLYVQRSRRRGRDRKIKKISVRKLEALADELRAVGDEQSAEHLECQAIELLDKKICRKIIRQSRRSSSGLGDLVMPLMEGIG